MLGRPLKFDNKAVIDKAQQIFWKKGYTGASLNNLLEAMNMGSGSFYNAFKGGKKELFQIILANRRKALEEFAAVADSSENPVETIKNFFRSIAIADKDEHINGCLVANTVSELMFVDEELANEAAAILKDVEHFYAETIRKAQKSGTVLNQTDPVILGRYLITLWNGLNVTRRMYQDNSLLLAQIEMQLTLIS
jgi:TetR/AcrR family transcriptional repressor of nem operon